MPFFGDLVKANTETITIADSVLTELSPLDKKEWGKLEQVIFTRSPQLSCDVITKLKRPGLEVLSECVFLKEDCGCDNPERFSICLGAALTLLLVTLLLATMFAVYAYRHHSKNGVHTRAYKHVAAEDVPS